MTIWFSIPIITGMVIQAGTYRNNDNRSKREQDVQSRRHYLKSVRQSVPRIAPLDDDEEPRLKE